MSTADLIRITLVRDGVTYDVELTQVDTAELAIGFDVSEPVATALDGWAERLPTGDGTVRFTAHGRLKAERRAG